MAIEVTYSLSLLSRMSTITQIVSNMKILKACMSVVPGDEREDLIEDDQ